MNLLNPPRIKLILDQGLPADSAEMFRELGYECWHASDIGYQRAEDEEILLLAIERNAIIVTLDADFHALVAVRRLRRPSVVRLRREGCRAATVVEIVSGVLHSFRSQLEAGSLISIRQHRVSVHRLPIGSEGSLE